MAEGGIRGAVEFIADRLYYAALGSTPEGSEMIHYFSIDQDLEYEFFFADFGPLNLGQVLDNKLKDSALQGKKIYYYSSTDGHKRANAAYLISSYAVIRLQRQADEAYRPLLGLHPPFIPFRDASFGICTFNLTIMDCLRAIEKAISLNYFNFDTFDIQEYEYYEKVENGDLNWLVPGKFLAFSGPSSVRQQVYEGVYTMTPEDYVPYFKSKGVTAVIRLNKKCYDRRRFTEQGINHYDLYFLDGSTPPEHILRRFLEICENERGGIAVHCKAGLGRTGTLIACYMMKHDDWTASTAIGWLRICRPGSVIGPQQHYLKDWESRLRREGELNRRRSSLGENTRFTEGSVSGSASSSSKSTTTNITTELKSLSLSTQMRTRSSNSLVSHSRTPVRLSHNRSSSMTPSPISTTNRSQSVVRSSSRTPTNLGMIGVDKRTVAATKSRSGTRNGHKQTTSTFSKTYSPEKTTSENGKTNFSHVRANSRAR